MLCYRDFNFFAAVYVSHFLHVVLLTYSWFLVGPIFRSRFKA